MATRRVLWTGERALAAGRTAHGQRGGRPRHHLPWPITPVRGERCFASRTTADKVKDQVVSSAESAKTTVREGASSVRATLSAKKDASITGESMQKGLDKAAKAAKAGQEASTSASDKTSQSAEKAGAVGDQAKAMANAVHKVSGSSDTIWIITSLVVFVPLLFYMTSPPGDKKDAHDHGHSGGEHGGKPGGKQAKGEKGDDEEEGEEGGAGEGEGESQDDAAEDSDSGDSDSDSEEKKEAKDEEKKSDKGEGESDQGDQKDNADGDAKGKDETEKDDK